MSPLTSKAPGPHLPISLHCSLPWALDHTIPSAWEAFHFLVFLLTFKMNANKSVTEPSTLRPEETLEIIKTRFLFLVCVFFFFFSFLYVTLNAGLLLLYCGPLVSFPLLPSSVCGLNSLPFCYFILIVYITHSDLCHFFSNITSLIPGDFIHLY